MDAHPTGGIDATLRRISAASADGLSLRTGLMPDPAPGWIAVDRLLHDDGQIASLLARVSGVRERPAEHVCAEWMVESWARAIADLAGSAIVCDRRLPDLRPGNLLVAPHKGMVAAIAVRTGAMAALDGDGPAIAAGAAEVAGWTDLADAMHRGLEELLEPMIEWTAGRHLRPARTLWRAAGDRLAQSLIWSGRAFGQPEFALELSGYLISIGGRTAVPLDRDFDRTGEPFHLRTTCCLAYRTPEGGLCRACPIGR
ncbi:MAG: (2Fe-2S)-binding protein [Solirubrobacterales bacterium]|nr:(2Fe-2S)-binding protein [Solirubrobacterales bacterium]